MAAIEEAIRIVLEAEGAEGIKTLRKVLADLGETGELTREQVGDLAGEVLKFGEAAADSAGITRAIDRYQELAATQGDVADAMEAARLKLSILAEAETDAARAVQERRRALDDARGALADYQNSVDKTSEGLAEQRRQVSDASAALKKAEDSWGSITASLAGANDEFDAAYKAQERLNAGLERHGDRIREAGLSTDDLADAQAELATRTEAAGRSLADQIQNARSAAAAQRELGEQTKRTADAAAEAERDFANAWRSLGGDGALRDASAEITRLESAFQTLAESGRLSAEQIGQAQEQLQQRIQKVREGTAEYRAEQERLAEQTRQTAEEVERTEKALAALEAESGSGIRALRTSLEEMADASKLAGENTGDLAAELQALGSADKVVSDFTRLKATLRETDTQLDEARTALTRLNQEFGRSDRDSRRASDAYRHAEQQVERLSRQQRAQTLELQRASGALNKAGVDTRNLGTAQQFIRDRMHNTSQKIGEVNRGLSNMGGAASQATTNVQGVGKQFDVLQFSLTRIAALAASVAAGLKGIALGGDAFGAAVQLEQQLAEVQSVAGGAAEQMTQLRDAAQEAAAHTGMSMDAVTSGMAELARAGLDTEQTIAALTPTLDLAQGAGVGLAEAVEITTTTLTQFGLAATDAQRVADVLAQSANSSQSSVQGLGSALGYVAPLANQLGMNLEETTAILSALADEGYRGERAGTALRNMFSQMMDPSSKFREELEKLGITGNDFGQILQQLAAKGEEGKRALLTLDQAARPAILSLFNKGGESIRRFTVDLENAKGAAASTAAVVRDTLGTAWARFRQTSENALSNLIGPLLKPLQAELEALASRVDAFAKSPAFAELRDELTRTFEGGLKAVRNFTDNIDFGQISEDLSDLMVVLGNTVDMFNMMADQMAFAAELATKISLAAKAVEALRAGLGNLSDVVRDNRDAMDGLTAGMGRSATGARDMSASLKAAEEQMKTLRDGAKPAAAAVADVGTATEDAAQKSADAAAQLRQVAVSAFTELVTSATASSEQVREAFSKALDPELTKEQVERLRSALRVAFEAGTISAEEFGDALEDMSDRVSAAGATIEHLAHRSGEVWAQLQQAIKDGAAPEIIERLQQRFELLGQRIKEAERAATGMGQAMGDAAGQVMTLDGAFTQLSLTSQAKLAETREKALLAFNTISSAAKEGKAATEDVTRAFEAYARAAQEAAKHSTELERKQVEAQLRIKGSSLGLTESLERLGLAGKKAGDDTADSMGRAGQALSEVAESAEDAATAMDGITSSATTAASATHQMAEGIGHVTRQVMLTNDELEGTSKLFQELANDRFGERVSGAFNSIRLGNQRLQYALQEQTKEYDRQLASLQEQNMAMDEVGQRVLELRRQFSYLSDDRLRALAQEQLRYEQATGAGAEQNRNLASGNELLRERNALLDKQGQQLLDKQGQQTVQTTKVVEVRLTAGVGRVEFNVDEIQRADIRKLAKLIIQEIEMDRQ